MIQFKTAINKHEFIHLYHRYLKDLSLYSKSVNDQTDEWIDEHYFSDMQLQKQLIQINGETVGFIVLQYVDETCGIQPPLWYIVEFFILPQFRGKGYGTKTVGLFLLNYPGDFFYYILKGNIPAKHFWAHITKVFQLNEFPRMDIVDPDPELETHSFKRS